jgi:hypothetical protein
MKRSLVLIMALLLATPALGTVTITCTDEGSSVCQISYTVTGEPAKVRAFALDVSVDSGAIIDDIGNYPTTGEGNQYGIYPGSIDLTDPNTPVYGDPIAPSSDPGAEGTGKGTSRVIIEMGSLYEPNLAGPPNSGILCDLTMDANGLSISDCNVTIVVETTRGGVVLENGDTVSITSPGCKITFPSPGPPCWSFLTQCHGDSDGSGFVDTSDWPDFRDGFYKSYPDATYIANVCGDYNKDGAIDTVDWPEFRDNFYTSPPADCTPGGTWPP